MTAFLLKRQIHIQNFLSLIFLLVGSFVESLHIGCKKINLITSNSKNGGDMTDCGGGVRWTCVDWNELNDDSCIALALQLWSTIFCLRAPPWPFARSLHYERWYRDVIGQQQWIAHASVMHTQLCLAFITAHEAYQTYQLCQPSIIVAAAVRPTN